MKAVTKSLGTDWGKMADEWAANTARYATSELLPAWLKSPAVQTAFELLLCERLGLSTEDAQRLSIVSGRSRIELLAELYLNKMGHA